MMLQTQRVTHRPGARSAVIAAASASSPCRLPQLAASTLLAVSMVLVSPDESFLFPSYARADREDQLQKAVEEYAQLEEKGKLNQNSLNDIRSKYKLRRAIDGRIQLKSSKGEWISVRLDMEVPGALLMRDSKGLIFAIQTDTLQQIDLSDDMVCLLMFSDGGWESQMAPVEVTDQNGKSIQLKLNEKEFREIIGLLKEVGEEGEEDQGK
jgi:hypothetical protein